MSVILETIFQRRSIRNYKEDQITDEELGNIIKAGQYAPSARNEQSWHFSVVQSKEVLDKISGVIKGNFERSGNVVFEERAKAKNFSAFYHAPTLIILSGDDKAVAPQADASLALGNTFLAAAALGIGSCWIHAIRSLLDSAEGQSLKQVLGIPEGYSILGSGAFGYKAAETPKPAPRREGTVTIIK